MTEPDEHAARTHELIALTRSALEAEIARQHGPGRTRALIEQLDMDALAKAASDAVCDDIAKSVAAATTGIRNIFTEPEPNG